MLMWAPIYLISHQWNSIHLAFALAWRKYFTFHISPFFCTIFWYFFFIVWSVQRTEWRHQWSVFKHWMHIICMKRCCVPIELPTCSRWIDKWKEKNIRTFCPLKLEYLNEKKMIATIVTSDVWILFLKINSWANVEPNWISLFIAW